MRQFSWFGTNVSNTTQYQPMYTINGTKPSILQRNFKFKVKCPLTFTQTGALSASNTPVDLPTKKRRYMLMYPIPAEVCWRDDNGDPPNNGGDILFTSTSMILPAWHL